MRLHKIDGAKLLPGSMHFNPAVTCFQNRRIMAYRLEDRSAKSWAQIAICELDGDWQPIPDSNRLIALPEPHPGTTHFEDPRLYPDGNKLRMSFISATFSERQHVAAQGFAALDCNFNVEAVSYPAIGYNLNLASRGDKSKKTSEKNWTLIPDLNGILYQINPLTIYRDGQIVRESKADVRWSFGRWSGSTPLIPWGRNLLGCFHSFVYGEDGQRTYHAGWYTFDPETWRLIEYSEKPFLSGIYDEDEKRPFGSKWVPRAVFPCGLIAMDRGVALSYGWLDSTCRMAFFSPEEIDESLVPVTKWYERKEVLHNPWGGIPGGFNCTVGDKELRARTWPAMTREAKSKNVDLREVHKVLCGRVDAHYKRLEWVEA